MRGLIPLALLIAIAIGAVPGANAALPDNRGWELVSPVDKNGGRIDPPGTLAGGGAPQAAAGGGVVTYGSATSFGPGAQGAPPASQYISRRGPSGWSTENITAPVFSGSFGTATEGTPYRIFSPDLGLGLLLNGRHCRGADGSCAVANPPLAGTDAPAGFQNYYLRDNGSGAYRALLGAAAIAQRPLDPAGFELALAGASPDLRHVVLSTCAALTVDATEVPLGGGCDPAAQNLYRWSNGSLELVNLLPAAVQGTPGAALAAQSRAISSDGNRVYWSLAGNLYLREGGVTKLVGSGVSFETAGADGEIAFLTAGGHLLHFEAASGSSVDLTPGGGVEGVLGASADGSRVYYAAAGKVFLWNEGEFRQVTNGPVDPGSYPPTTGSARVSADGNHLAIVSSAPLTGYDNTKEIGDVTVVYSEVFVYDAVQRILLCASCKSGNRRPIGSATIPAAIANGSGPGATRAYKPRALSADGSQLFFDSGDNLATADTNNDRDVYEWRARGTGGCATAGGCVGLLSSGTAEDGASFVDASSDGSDVFFLTDGSLVANDPGSVDLYDARIGGGFPLPEAKTPCEGDACQSLPTQPTDPSLTTTARGLGNAAVHYVRVRSACTKKQVRRHGRCVKKKAKKRQRHHGKKRGRGGR